MDTEYDQLNSESRRTRRPRHDLGDMMTPLRLEPRLTIRDRVAAILRLMILEGRMRPGQWLPEEEIARQLNVSRMPVREAFSVLEAEGLLQRVPNRGAAVAEFSLEDAEEIYRLRALLEGLAAEQAAARLNGPLLARFAEAVEELSRCVAEGDFADINALHLRLHSLLWGAAGRTLANLCQMLYQKHPKDVVRVRPNRAAESVEDWKALLEAVARRDGPAAGQVMRRHIEEGGRVIVEHLSRLRTS